MNKRQRYKLVIEQMKSAGAEIHYLFGNKGICILPRTPASPLTGKGYIYRLFTIVPLDGFIADPKEVVRIIRERGLEL